MASHLHTLGYPRHGEQRPLNRHRQLILFRRNLGAEIVQTDVPVLLQYGVDSAHTYARGTVQYTNLQLSPNPDSGGAPLVAIQLGMS